MKKRIFLIASLTLIVCIVLFAYNKVDAQTLMDTAAGTAIQGQLNTAPASNLPALRERLKADINGRIENVRVNQEMRNDLIEHRVGSTTASTSPRRPVNPPLPIMGKPAPRIGSSSAEYRNELREKGILASTTRGMNIKEALIKVKVFDERKNHVIKQLKVAYNNLIALRDRVKARIDKESQNGHNMDEATKLLQIANSKIILVNDAINKIANQKATATLATSTDCVNSPETDCIGQVGQESFVNREQFAKPVEDAKKAIKDAHQALIQVVTEIAHSLGIKLEAKVPVVTPTTNASSTNITQ